MNIKHVFEDSRIVMLEKDIARINEYCQYSDEEKFVMKHLLKKALQRTMAIECV